MRLVSKLFFCHHAWLPGCSLGCREMGGVSDGGGELCTMRRLPGLGAPGAQPKVKRGRDVAWRPHSVPRDKALQDEGSRSPRCPPITEPPIPARSCHSAAHAGGPDCGLSGRRGAPAAPAESRDHGRRSRPHRAVSQATGAAPAHLASPASRPRPTLGRSLERKPPSGSGSARAAAAGSRALLASLRLSWRISR